MNVTLLNYTTDALDLLLFTKQTRLAQSPGLLEEIKMWSIERKLAELDYMLGTIHSSWEFVDYTFLVDGVTRAFTHQLVRTRSGSYAQQSQRTVDMEGFTYVIPNGIQPLVGAQELSTGSPYTQRDLIGNLLHGDERASNLYGWAMDAINYAYAGMRAEGVPPQDARGVLPTNVTTNIVAKFNLRSLSDMAKVRLCTRTQGEYQTVFRAMRDAVLAVHPWAEPFIRVHCAATGVCCFPNYTECPIKGPVFNPATGRRWDCSVPITFLPVEGSDEGIPLAVQPATTEEIQRAWRELPLYEAVPKQVTR